MASIQVDFSKKKGKIKPLHGVGQPPFSGIDFGMFHYLGEAGIPYSRLHDVGGAFGRNLFVDIPNIFRDFDRDPYDEESYDFAFTDLLISALVEAGVEPFFRLGVTIENYAKIKSYRIDPPKDPHKWAVICEHIIRHYTEGWADGFRHKITYWEIWNEPDNCHDPRRNEMWTGTNEEYYELYDVAARHIKQCFPHLKVGGYASCGFYAILNDGAEAQAKNPQRYARQHHFLEFFDGFLDFIKKKKSPIDFFSWHSYGSVEDTRVYARYLQKRLCEAGYGTLETSLNEWNVDHTERGTYRHAAKTLAMMLMLQGEAVDSAMFYDARLGISSYGGMFHALERTPYPAYYAFVAFNRLYRAGEEVETHISDENLYAVAAVGEGDGWIVISNTTEEDIPLSLSCQGEIGTCYITDENGCELAREFTGVIPKESLVSIQIKL